MVVLGDLGGPRGISGPIGAMIPLWTRCGGWSWWSQRDFRPYWCHDPIMDVVWWMVLVVPEGFQALLVPQSHYGRGVVDGVGGPRGISGPIGATIPLWT